MCAMSHALAVSCGPRGQVRPPARCAWPAKQTLCWEVSSPRPVQNELETLNAHVCLLCLLFLNLTAAACVILASRLSACLLVPTSSLHCLPRLTGDFSVLGDLHKG